MIMDTHNSNATRLFLQFGYISEHYAQAHLSTVINDQFIIWTITMYNYFTPLKGVNKYMKLIILTLYSCDMIVPYKANSH